MVIRFCDGDTGVEVGLDVGIGVEATGLRVNVTGLVLEVKFNNPLSTISKSEGTKFRLVVKFCWVVTAVIGKLANSNIPVGDVVFGGEAIIIVTLPEEFASAMLDFSMILPKDAVGLISPDNLTLVVSKVKTTFA